MFSKDNSWETQEFHNITQGSDASFYDGKVYVKRFW